METQSISRYQQAVVYLLLTLVTYNASAMTDKLLNKNIQQLRNSISDSKNHTLETTPAFPCSAIFEESLMAGGKKWVKKYQFNFEDIEPGSHFQIRDQRRTMIYTATLITETGEKKEFSPKRVNNLSYPLTEHINGREIQALIDTIIIECRNRNDF